MDNYKKAVFGMGCFWCAEAVFEELEGVISVESGYAGPANPSPSAPDYEKVSAGKTEYAEAVEITFDSEKISYGDLLEVFWSLHDPTQLNRQGSDVGRQYRSVIFYNGNEQRKLAEESKKKLDESGEFKNPVVTEITPFEKFYPAEGFHQDFYRRNPEAPYCQAVINPKLEKLREKFGSKLKRQ